MSIMENLGIVYALCGAAIAVLLAGVALRSEFESQVRRQLVL